MTIHKTKRRETATSLLDAVNQRQGSAKRSRLVKHRKSGSQSYSSKHTTTEKMFEGVVTSSRQVQQLKVHSNIADVSKEVLARH